MAASAPKECYTREEALRLLGVTERRLKSWEKHGLLPQLAVFTLADLRVVQTLESLHRDRVPAATIELVVAAIRRKLQDIDDPLKQLRLISDGRRVRVEIAGQRIEPLSGQILLDFHTPDLKRLMAFPKENPAAARRARREEAESWFQKGLQLEQSGASVQEAVEAYEKAVKLDPASAGAWLNLGTIHFNARLWAPAERFYRKALEADPGYALAHFNLGNLYDERGEWALAVRHYSEAIRLNGSYADAHYNLALLYQNRGKVMDAVRHWSAYLKLDPQSQWADIARRELDKLKKSTVVEGRLRASS